MHSDIWISQKIKGSEIDQGTLSSDGVKQNAKELHELNLRSGDSIRFQVSVNVIAFNVHIISLK